MNLIGINGRLRSGKDTAFEIVRRAYASDQITVRREAFADRLKISAAAALGVNNQDALEFCDALKVGGTITVDSPAGDFEISGREYLQRYGTEAHRDVFGPDFWIDALLPHASGHPSRGNRQADNASALNRRFPRVDVLVITDVRFPNEARRILALGGQVWKIEADERLGALTDDAHPSERPLPDALVTHIVPNNGTLDEFERNVREVLR